MPKSGLVFVLDLQNRVDALKLCKERLVAAMGS